jgi:hypothetical protein
MKRITVLFSVTILALAASPGFAHEGHASHGMAAHMNMGSASKTITGEVVDTGCYLGSGERGAKHVSCATKCIDQGMPMGLLTSSGKLYLLTLNHDNADPYNDIKKMAGKMVSVTGPVLSRSGMTAIDVTAFTPASTSGAK